MNEALSLITRSTVTPWRANHAIALVRKVIAEGAHSSGRIWNEAHVRRVIGGNVNELEASLARTVGSPACHTMPWPIKATDALDVVRFTAKDQFEIITELEPKDGEVVRIGVTRAKRRL